LNRDEALKEAKFVIGFSSQNRYPPTFFCAVDKTQNIFYVKELLGHKNSQSTQVYVHIERSLFLNAPPDEYHVKVAKTQEKIIQLLETGFEYVLQKDDLACFGKRK
jgi:hypothetical protein